ncbi:MAG: class I tRNA ligase family protein [bacterium]|nr:class I tRNA ligase family protein [bacterium]
MPFDPVDPAQRLPDLEEGILQYWREEDTFKRSIRKHSADTGDVLDKPELKSRKVEKSGDRTTFGPSDSSIFSFYDGPPFATGLPHYGHLLAGTIKDVIPRYQTMRGKTVQRRFGWDCHGLPIENLIEKEHDIKDKQQIEEMGIGAFNDLCRSAVQRHASDWRTVVERMGRWVDMDWDYKTMDPEYMESIWWVFSQLHKKDYIYEGRKSMHVCPRCVTPLSNFEVTLGYLDVSDWTTFTKYPLIDDPNTVLLAWTTTTWTLPGNLFLAIGKDIPYVKVRSDDCCYIVAEPLVEKVFAGEEYEIVGKIAAKELIGKSYEPLFPYFVDRYKDQNAFRIVEADFVTIEDGTGIVHIAPGFGTDDYELGKREGVEVLSHVGMNGHFVDEVTDFAGQEVKPMDDPTKTDKAIAKKLEEMGRLFKAESYKHSYPHCWRCDSPLINYSTASWFVAVEKFKPAMLKANSRTEWVPSHVRDGRFGKWLENARDWAISRNRYWGTPLPIWRQEMENATEALASPHADVEVIGSRDDLMKKKLIRFTKITTLRHAESEGNLIPIYQGELPGTDLTKKGITQATKAGEWLKTQSVDIIYCSPLARTQQTAQEIAKQTGAKVIVDDRLREVRFGEWEGKAVDFSDLTFIKERRAHKIENNKPESIYHFDGMESWESVQNRLSSFLEEMLPRHRSEHVVVVTHADPMVNIEHFFTKEDALKLSHRPYPEKAVPKQYFWDHDKQQQLDLHKDTVDDVSWMGAQNEKSVELILVRHGQTDWNAQSLSQGHTDNNLNETGIAQAHETAKALKNEKIDVIISSDLKRAKQTAEIIGEELGLEVTELWKDLRERDEGVWDGKHIDEVLKDYPSTNNESKSVSFHHLTPPEGESFSAFISRIEKSCQKLLEHYAGKKVIVVSHGGTTRALCTVIQNLGYDAALRMRPKNASIIPMTLNPFLKRIPEVLDCWFESGSMPYAQEHFPFEFKHRNEKTYKRKNGPSSFPANFIAEGMDQTRGWFYTLTVLGAALFEQSPFENCVVNGTVLAEDGKKMSKKLQNYPDPMVVIHKHGADAIRFSLMSSPAVRGEDLRFSEKVVQETVRSVLLPLWNTYSFFVTYANAAKYEPIDTRRKSEHPLDVWILSEVQDLTNRMTSELDNYDLSATCAQLHETIDALTNWYIRLSRRRFAGKGVLDAYPDSTGDAESQDQHDALITLNDVLLTLSQLLAPFCPYITEAIYLNLVPEDHGSVHLTDWPETKELSSHERQLLEKNRIMRLVVSLGNSVRAEAKVKIRQPLQKATIALPAGSNIAMTASDVDLLRQELNVKEVDFTDNPDELAESFMLVDARKVGPRLGKRVQEIIIAGKEGNFTIEPSGSILILDETLSPEEAQLTYRGKEGQNAAADRGVVICIDTEVTDALQLEGDARDIIRGVQRVRKETGLEFTDEITLAIDGGDDVIAEHKKLIESETRSTIGESTGDDHEIDVGDQKLVIRFQKR